MADDTEQDPAAPRTPTGNPLHHVPLEITVSVGRARPLIGELMALGEGAVLALDSRVDDPVELYAGDKLIARGRLEESAADGGLAVRLTEIADLRSGL